jgi:drug/metabolite transporter (DMT)-like permease
MRHWMAARATRWTAWRGRWQSRAASWSPTTRGLLWAACAGFSFSLLNTMMRGLTLDVDPMQSQFLRYAMGLLVLMPVVLMRGMRHYKPSSIRGQLWRGAMHTGGLMLWFLALPKIPLADMTAIGFTGPIFVMIGARLFFGEPMRWERWAATLAGLVGVLIVVAPRLSGEGGVWHLVMLASAPLFAASFLITKALTRHETTGTILVWQSITVALLSLPLAMASWQPISVQQWLGFLACGVMGSLGHYGLTRSFAVADISATQSLKFLDLIWSAFFGFLIFGDLPTSTTMLGGLVIATATVWVARREALMSREAQRIREDAERAQTP